MPSADPRLDWQPRHDPRSRSYPVRAALPKAVRETGKQWLPGRVVTDQGHEGACVGHAWTNDALAAPKADTKATAAAADVYARGVYRSAQRIDEWPGEAYDGTSVLAGAKVMQSRGHMVEYRWAFSIDDVKDSVIERGPVVIGVPWFEDMYQTGANGLVRVGGPLVGGHALLVYGYHPGASVPGVDGPVRLFRWRNSWGRSYGINGNGWIRYEDLRDLLAGQGEACVPVGRRTVRL